MEMQVFYKNYPINYILTRKKVKNINLRVKSDLKVHISASKSVSIKKIEQFIVDNGDFIIKHIENFKKNTVNLQNHTYTDGDIFYFSGKKLMLKITRDGNESVYFDDEILHLHTRNTQDFGRNKQLVDKFFDEKCVEIFMQIIDKIYPIFKQLGVKCPVIKMRNMKSRWGSCIPSKNRITLNKRLIFTPIQCIEYVILHEFAHFIHPNHSKDFHNFVGNLMIDYKERKAVLRTFSEVW